ncbi:hypothetical protein HK097_007797 [Rhizophlyctis rosea]|uniref:Uncharacterized protein n=1 Tax=Rhizophlyctis rosea TaxID=64517 RepID=A0AAD5SK61_9FUNG|nr:hypothetical protein HK097_007797 [Rhizophlyctis rosea]
MAKNKSRTVKAAAAPAQSVLKDAPTNDNPPELPQKPKIEDDTQTLAHLAAAAKLAKSTEDLAANKTSVTLGPTSARAFASASLGASPRTSVSSPRASTARAAPADAAPSPKPIAEKAVNNKKEDSAPASPAPARNSVQKAAAPAQPKAVQQQKEEQPKGSPRQHKKQQPKPAQQQKEEQQPAAQQQKPAQPKLAQQQKAQPIQQQTQKQQPQQLTPQPAHRTPKVVPPPIPDVSYAAMAARPGPVNTAINSLDDWDKGSEVYTLSKRGPSLDEALTFEWTSSNTLTHNVAHPGQIGYATLGLRLHNEDDRQSHKPPSRASTFSTLLDEDFSEWTLITSSTFRKRPSRSPSIAGRPPALPDDTAELKKAFERVEQRIARRERISDGVDAVLGSGDPFIKRVMVGGAVASGLIVAVGLVRAWWG